MTIILPFWLFVLLALIQGISVSLAWVFYIFWREEYLFRQRLKSLVGKHVRQFTEED